MSKEFPNLKGFTAIEAVVYVSLVAILSVLVVQTIIALSSSFAEVRSSRDLGNSAMLALDRVGKEIKLADAIGEGSVFGTTTGKLILFYKDGISTTTKEISVASSTLRLLVNGVEEGPLTTNFIKVTSFFIERATSSKNTVIRVTLTLKDENLTPHRQATFYSAASMRKTY